MKAGLNFLLPNYNHSTSLFSSSLRNLAAHALADDLSAEKALWNHLTLFTNKSYINSPLEYQDHYVLSLRNSDFYFFSPAAN